MENWNPETKLADSSFNGEFLIGKLRQNCETFREIEEHFNITDIKAKDISEGSGYLSKVYKCDFSFAPKNLKSYDRIPSFSVILKEPGTQCVEDTIDTFSIDKEASKSAMAAMDNWISIMHHNESTVYNHLSSENLPLPKFYGSGDRGSSGEPGYLIIEFLENAYFPQLHEGLTLDQAKNLIDFVIDLQSTAMKSGDWWKEELTPTNFGDDQDITFVNSLIESLTKHKNERFVELVGIYKKLLVDPETCLNACGKDYDNSGLPKVFTHGDMWTNNISFKIDPSTKKLTDEIKAIVDWQIACAANPFLDICRILLMCCTPEVRRTLEVDIVDYYINRIGQLSEKNSKKITFKKEEIEECKKYADIANLVFFMFMSVLHYRSESPETKRKQDIVLERLQAAMEDLLPMAKNTFPQYLTLS